jgi:hypothetical protein
MTAAAGGDRRHQGAGLWSVWGDGARPRSLEAPLASVAKRGAEMADRHVIENREAAIGVRADGVSHAAALGDCGVAGVNASPPW